MGMLGSYGNCFGTYGWAGGLIGLLLNIGILAGIVLLIVWAARQFTRSGTSAGDSSSSSPQPRSAREVLDLRYAKGELTREEYLAMVEDLSGTTGM